MPTEAAFLIEDDPIGAVSIARAALLLGDPDPASRLVRSWTGDGRTRSTNPDSPLRYPWPITAGYADLPSYVPTRASWRAWRDAEEAPRLRDREGFEARLLVPVILSDAVDVLERVPAPDTETGARLLAELLPVIRRDIAKFAIGGHAWGDTWALWNVARRQSALRRLHPFALAIADTYASRAIEQGSIGTGSRFPFHDVPLVSVSAQLASGLLALGVHPKLTGRLAAWTADQELPFGGWGDAGLPPDPLTTLVAADLLAGIDPAWDPARSGAWLASQRRVDGTFLAYGPEVAWLTHAVNELLECLDQPFADRFRWPELATHQRDRRTGLPFLGYLADLARLCAEVPALGSTTVQLAFLDLAGFGAWNNVFGMAAGDEVLRFLATELDSIPNAVAIRDGGDEFVLVGAPGGHALPAALETFRHQFPTEFRRRFGPDALPVAPRILTTRVSGSNLIEGRDRLGKEISALKEFCPVPPPEGVMREAG